MICLLLLYDVGKGDLNTPLTKFTVRKHLDSENTVASMATVSLLNTRSRKSARTRTYLMTMKTMEIDRNWCLTQSTDITCRTNNNLLLLIKSAFGETETRGNELFKSRAFYGYRCFYHTTSGKDDPITPRIKPTVSSTLPCRWNDVDNPRNDTSLGSSKVITAVGVSRRAAWRLVGMAIKTVVLNCSSNV